MAGIERFALEGRNCVPGMSGYAAGIEPAAGIERFALEGRNCVPGMSGYAAGIEPAAGRGQMQQLGVLGLGYIGLPTASLFATHRFRVVGVDVAEEVVARLRNGSVHIDEPDLQTLVQAALRSGNLTVSEQPEPAEAFIIAVPTPLREAKEAAPGIEELRSWNGAAAPLELRNCVPGMEPRAGMEGELGAGTGGSGKLGRWRMKGEGKRADLSCVEAAARSIVPHLRKGNLVILESTVPPGTTREVVAPILEESGLDVGRDLMLAYCPERVLPGRILYELVENDRVVGGYDRASTERAQALYQTFVKGRIYTTDCTTAEMVKLMENTYRDVNIALANEFALIAEHVGVNVWEAIDLANCHPRVHILRPGPGVGGHCIAVDPWFLVDIAPQYTALTRQSRWLNDWMPEWVARKVEAVVGDPRGSLLAVWGLAYKANVGDVSESPALHVIRCLSERGYTVRVYDPHVQTCSSLPLYEDWKATIDGADGLVLLTDHEVFRRLPPADVAACMRQRILIDMRHSVDLEDWRAAGFICVRLGDGRGLSAMERDSPADDA